MNGAFQSTTADTSISTSLLSERISRLTQTLESFRDSQARFALLTEWARRRSPLDPAWRLEKFRVPGCQVRLWWVPRFDEGRCWFGSDSDALTLKAVTGLLADVYSGCTPEDILRNPPDFLDRLGLLRPLAENRAATVRRVVEDLLAEAKYRAAERDAFRTAFASFTATQNPPVTNIEGD